MACRAGAPERANRWTINFSTHGRFRTVHVPVDADTTEADIQRLIEKKIIA